MSFSILLLVTHIYRSTFRGVPFLVLLKSPAVGFFRCITFERPKETHETSKQHQGQFCEGRAQEPLRPILLTS
jgi:hypothetical protein